MTATLRVKIGERWYTVEVGDLDEFPIQAVVDGELVEVEMGDMPAAMSPQTHAADIAVQPSEPAQPAPAPTPQRTAQTNVLRENHQGRSRRPCPASSCPSPSRSAIRS